MRYLPPSLTLGLALSFVGTSLFAVAPPVARVTPEQRFTKVLTALDEEEWRDREAGQVALGRLLDDHAEANEWIAEKLEEGKLSPEVKRRLRRGMRFVKTDWAASLRYGATLVRRHADIRRALRYGKTLHSLLRKQAAAYGNGAIDERRDLVETAVRDAGGEVLNAGSSMPKLHTENFVIAKQGKEYFFVFYTVNDEFSVMPVRKTDAGYETGIPLEHRRIFSAAERYWLKQKHYGVYDGTFHVMVDISFEITRREYGFTFKGDAAGEGSWSKHLADAIGGAFVAAAKQAAAPNPSDLDLSAVSADLQKRGLDPAVQQRAWK